MQCARFVQECTQAYTNLPNPSWMYPREGSGGAEAGRSGRGGGLTGLVRTRFRGADGRGKSLMKADGVPFG